MYTVEIIIYIIIGILGGSFVTIAIFNQSNTRKQEKNNQKNVESIQIGDTFGHNNFKVTGVDDPFSENYGTQGFDPQYYVTILDIKKNYNDETWVKYCFTQHLNTEYNTTFTDELNSFLRYRTRIIKRIDNINTGEE